MVEEVGVHCGVHGYKLLLKFTQNETKKINLQNKAYQVTSLIDQE